MWLGSVLVLNFNFYVHFQNAVHVCVYFQVTFLPERKGSSLWCHIVVCVLCFKF
jgi:hypothetical protein